MAVELYDGPSGATYLQLSDVLVNGKFEMRDCAPFPAPIDKSAYGKMGKVTLAPGGVLERGADGVLRYTVGQGQAQCVAPDNVKFDHNATYSLSELADRAALTGTPITPSVLGAAGLPPLKKGVKLVFLAAPDLDLA